MKRLMSLCSVVAVAAAVAAIAIPGGATAESSLPTLNIALQGESGVSVSGSEVSGAVNIVTTFQGSAPSGGNGPSFVLARLNPGATFQQAAAAVQAAQGDLNAVTPYASLVVSGGPGTVQAVLTPGNWVALNATSNGQPAAAPFTVTQAANPAALPKAQAYESAMEFAFHGPKVLHEGTIVRETNEGWLVHMIQFIGVKSEAAGKRAMMLLAEGKDNEAGRYFDNVFFGMGPVTHGGMQQQVVTAKPGYYVQACFMNTQDGREHTQLGMLRLIKVVK